MDKAWMRVAQHFRENQFAWEMAWLERRLIRAALLGRMGNFIPSHKVTLKKAGNGRYRLEKGAR